jgi:S-adenosylmethionine:tRNA ribosyltransferase-isomerase
MVSYRDSDRITHTRFDEIGRFLHPGDLLVVNASATMPASLPARSRDGASLELHLSTAPPDGRWVVELRQFAGNGTTPLLTAVEGEGFTLPNGGRVRLEEAYAAVGTGGVRLWVASLQLPDSGDSPAAYPLSDELRTYLSAVGAPIRYGYVRKPWPIEFYQTAFATEVGSAEMPSAGRPFTADLLKKLTAAGVQVAPLILHTGVASQEESEPPYPEYFRMSEETAAAVNAAHAAGKRVIAVGTTVVRALETVTGANRRTLAGDGWTNAVITPERGVRAVDGLLTGLHEPRASHIAMLAAFTDPGRLLRAYRECIDREYLWHEFGDLHLILP